VVLECVLKRLDIVSVSDELGCMCVDNFSEQVAVVALVVVDCSSRTDGRLAGDAVELELLLVLLALRRCVKSVCPRCLSLAIISST